MSEIYEASQIKRTRSTQEQIDKRRTGLFEIVKTMRPMTVRQVFYQATVRGLIEKSEAGYNKVQTDLTVMRRAATLPYGWLVDNTRWQRKPRTFSNIESALKQTAELYRKALWDDAETLVEIWLEKDALAGVILPITSTYDVPLMVARGYASLSFLHGAAEAMKDDGRDVVIHHLGDYDPSGVNAGEKIEQTLRQMAPNVDIYFQRLAVTEDQITEWALPTRPTKTTDSRSKNFGSISVELDAIEPAVLRELVETNVLKHFSQDRLRILKEAEESERKAIAAFVAGGAL